MTNIIVQHNQSIYDIVIQHYGSLDFLVQFCFDNKIGIDTDLTAGQVVVVDETIGVKSVKEFFKLNALNANNRQWTKYIVDYIKFLDVNTTAGSQPNMPSSAYVTYSDNSHGQADVTWESYSYQNPGIFIVNGIAKDAENLTIGVTVKLIVAVALSDLDILRQIRNANPTSQLPALWLDSEDPYTQWEGALFDKRDQNKLISVYFNGINLGTSFIWDSENHTFESPIFDLNINNIQGTDSINIKAKYINQLSIYNANIVSIDLSMVHKTNSLMLLSPTGDIMSRLTVININNNSISNVNNLIITHTNIQQLSGLTSKGSINYYDFRYNKLTTLELNRLRLLGFTDESKLLPQNP